MRRQWDSTKCILQWLIISLLESITVMVSVETKALCVSLPDNTIGFVHLTSCCLCCSVDWLYVSSKAARKFFSLWFQKGRLKVSIHVLDHMKIPLTPAKSFGLYFFTYFFAILTLGIVETTHSSTVLRCLNSTNEAEPPTSQHCVPGCWPASCYSSNDWSPPGWNNMVCST